MRAAIVIIFMVMCFGTCNASGFCDGFDEGYQAALEDCLRVGVTPICPIEPINSQGYKTGFGLGYAKAQRKYCN